MRSTQRSSHRQRYAVKYACVHVSQHGCPSVDPLARRKFFRFAKKGSVLRVPCRPLKPCTEDHVTTWGLLKEVVRQRDLEEMARCRRCKEQLAPLNYVPLNSCGWRHTTLGIIARHVRIRGPGGVTESQMSAGLINGTTRFTIEPAPKEVTSFFFHALVPKPEPRISGQALDRTNQTEYLVKNREQLCQIIQLEREANPSTHLGCARLLLKRTQLAVILPPLRAVHVEKMDRRHGLFLQKLVISFRVARVDLGTRQIFWPAWGNGAR